MTEGTKDRDRGDGGPTRRAAWLAWSLVTLSVALLLGGTALSRVAGSAVSDLSFVGEADDAGVVANLVTLFPFSVVGALVASRQPRNSIGWIFCGVGVTVGLRDGHRSLARPRRWCSPP